MPAHARVGREIAISHRGANSQAAPRRILNLVERKSIDIDELAGGLDLQLHQVEQIRSAADDFGARLG